MVEFAQLPTTSKIIVISMTDNVVMSEVDDFMYVVLNKREKHVSYGKVVGTTECKTL
jgi:glycine cleavage system H lipoate-binding protein